jgi:hypothetical protein
VGGVRLARFLSRSLDLPPFYSGAQPVGVAVAAKLASVRAVRLAQRTAVDSRRREREQVNNRRTTPIDVRGALNARVKI